LFRWPGPPDSVLRIRREPPADLEERRSARLLKALERKVPKLLEAAGKTATSVLVLDNRDLSLTNPSLVREGLEAAAGKTAIRLPDVVVLVDTFLQPPRAGVLYENGDWRDPYQDAATIDLST
jgi:hypothetical protein